MTTVLVTGATGFVGHHILTALAEAPVRRIAACRDPGRLPADYDGAVRPGDLRDETYLAGLLEGVDVVCHAAAWTSLYGNARHVRERFLAPSRALLAAVAELPFHLCPTSVSSVKSNARK